jgi:hypothetical protein
MKRDGLAYNRFERDSPKSSVPLKRSVLPGDMTKAELSEKGEV